MGLIDSADAAGYDNPDEVEEADGLQHLRDVFDVDGEEDECFEDVVEHGGDEQAQGSRSEFPPAPSTHPSSSAEAQQTEWKAPTEPAEWTWDMPLRDRWEAIEDFMLSHKLQLELVLGHVRKQLPIARKQLQEATVRASAKVYENKSVIGGTIVGCITRLEAIRETKPFAIITEEASEVLEPLLFACLTPSMVKFEQIGDHLQLSPSIMQARGYIRFPMCLRT